MAELLVFDFGAEGVNVDEDPLHMTDNQFRKAQNAHPDPAGAASGISNRMGLSKFSVVAAGPVLGGIGVPLPNLFTGTSFLFLGRGTK